MIWWRHRARAAYISSERGRLSLKQAFTLFLHEATLASLPSLPRRSPFLFSSPISLSLLPLSYSLSFSLTPLCTTLRRPRCRYRHPEVISPSICTLGPNDEPGPGLGHHRFLSFPSIMCFFKCLRTRAERVADCRCPRYFRGKRSSTFYVFRGRRDQPTQSEVE